jgi:uncharacterized protein (TIGR04255 family)
MTNKTLEAERHVRVPIKISPCPIIEAVVEVRFDSALPPDAIFGVIHQQFKSEYPGLESLPILQLPEAVRMAEPRLQHQPHYKMTRDDFVLQIGPKMLSISNTSEYVGWKTFSEIIAKALDQVVGLKLFSSANRVGIRYINYFPVDIFEYTNLTIKLLDDPYEAKQTTFRSVVKNRDLTSNVHLANGASIATESGPRDGSIVDIDTFVEAPPVVQLDQIMPILDASHSEEKRLFFQLIRDEYLKTFNPEYGSEDT